MHRKQYSTMNADSNLTLQLLSQRIIRKKRKHWKEANKGDNISEQISNTEKISKGNNTGLYGISIYTRQQHSKKQKSLKKIQTKSPLVLFIPYVKLSQCR